MEENIPAFIQKAMQNDNILMDATASSKKTGYLYQDFRLFHIADMSDRTFDYHYHEFNKIVITLSGNVTYFIEGKTYKLKPWDILLVNNHDVHKPVIDSSQVYDRIIIWVDSSFLRKFSQPDCDLTTCFRLADKKSFNLVRLDPALQERLQYILTHLEQAFVSEEFGSPLLAQSLFLEFLIYLNRIHLTNTYIYDPNSMEYDNQIVEMIAYIKENIGQDLSVDTLANHFFLSKHYLMHKFKSKTGYTLHNYILNRRLFKATELIREGMSISNAAAFCGFQDYSTFLRAFKKQYHCSPRDFFKNSTP